MGTGGGGGGGKKRERKEAERITSTTPAQDHLNWPDWDEKEAGEADDREAGTSMSRCYFLIVTIEKKNKN